MNCYTDVSYEQLNEIFLNLIQNIPELKEERVSVFNAKGRVLCKNVYLNEDIPSFSYANTDGFASDLHNIEKKGNIFKIGTYKKVNFGDYVDDKYNVVIPKDEIILKNNIPYTEYLPNMFEGIKYKGEGKKKGSFLFHKDEVLDDKKIGLLISYGIKKVSVYRKLKIGIVATLKSSMNLNNVKKKSIAESNSFMLSKLIENERVSVNIYKDIRDEKREYESIIKEISEHCDAIITIGRTGKGSNDFMYDVINKIGDVYIKGIRTIPASTFMLGKVKDSIIFSFPGDIISNMFMYNNFIKTFIADLTHIEKEEENFISGSLIRDVESEFYYKEFVYVNVFASNEGFKVLPIKSQKSSLFDFFNADGYFIVDENVKNLFRGEDIKVHLLKSLDSIYKNVLFCGADNPLNSKIMAYSDLKNINMILNSEGNDIKGNITSVEYVLGEFEGKSEHFKKEIDKGSVIIQGVKERYGFAVNKKYIDIKSVEDLVIKNVNFGNLPRNNFTRIVLEKILKSKKIDFHNIKGFKENIYKNEIILMEELLKDKFDICFISEKEAKNHNIKFVPVITKENDFVINTRDEELIRRIAFVFGNPSLREELSLDYNVENFGSVLRINNVEEEGVL
ncbi:molybdopterin-binding protein [Anaerofustis sp.]|uniref:molybdopterin-binding protein n=1 Tax=Anaerofustis sp. TaxID=1872517 RepID=UPI0025C080E4|nr:molybdopterin-binding protein [Anaerofustis sp.]